MRLAILLSLGLLFSPIIWAKTSSYFTITGDRVMINIQSGNAFSPTSDDDAIRLFEAMNVSPENSIMGKGKKIELAGAMTMIVADRGKGLYDGTVMIQTGGGVTIDLVNKAVEVRKEGEEAEFLAAQFKLEQGVFSFVSADGKLKLFVSPERFHLLYSESAW